MYERQVRNIVKVVFNTSPFLGMWLIFLSMEAALCDSLCWGRAPPSGQRESWHYNFKSQITWRKKNQQAEVSLHLVGLSCSHCFVFLLLHGVSDEPYGQDDEDTPEQCANHCTSNHSISHLCGTSSFSFIYQWIFMFLVTFWKINK